MDWINQLINPTESFNNYEDAKIVDYENNSPELTEDGSKYEKRVSLCRHIVESNPFGARKVLFAGGYPADMNNDELFQATLLMSEHPIHYNNLLKQMPEFDEIKNIISQENKLKQSKQKKYLELKNAITQKSKYKNATGQITNDLDYQIQKNKFTTSLMIICLASVFALVVYNKNK